MRRALMLAAVVGILLGPVGWVVSDRLEARNDFCNDCHLPSGVALHRELRDEFDARPAASLAALHAGSAVEGRHDAAFRCIDCHRGTGAVGRTRVKLLAAKDAFWYVVGRFEEPDGMRWPLWDADCRKCHPGFASEGDFGGPGPETFHARPVHNRKLGVGCVECHLVHGPGGNPDAWFVHAEPVRAQCARCHVEYEEGYE
jgi:nitrate/TMAO reductase-like tetraheme cytochrome c subunit